MASLLLNALVPVWFVILVGYVAGRCGLIPNEAIRSFSTVVIDIALPCTLFVGVFGFRPAQFENVAYIATLATTFVVPFVAGVVIAVRYYRRRMPEASLFACNCGFPDMAFFGLPVVTVIVGPQGLLPVIVGNILTSILIIPPVMAMLHHHGDKEDSGLLIGEVVIQTFRRPIVWAPILAFVLALAGLQIPALAAESLKLVGGITGGLALLTLGLMLSELTPRFDKEAAIISLLKNFVAPAMVVAAAKLLHLPRDLSVGAVIIAACPSATIAAMLSSQFAVARDKIPGQILASNLVAFVSMPLWILVAEKL